MPMRVLIMGVSGAGKTRVGKALANRLGVAFIDSDDFHPKANVAKMSSGQALTDADRQPWLERLNRELHDRTAGCVLACSALKRTYRLTLGQGLHDLHWVHLDADFETIRRRMRGRDHFMPASLLRSQFQTLEPPSAAQAFIIDGSQSVERIVDQVVGRLGQT